ncbi:LOW QUALITY PROTEIN: interferon-induced very large GTPase 1-like [Peromyscus maniculatus bairdii]|uniref:LOW QUALITY PROTEIN: interferon-induced very large GTPase 1-like n=1 Tax=Peromyscus maniculatus bairdii TaxID=230844 RepID=UPI001C2E86C1|nr:LOW QUALITY PROTEIN: interferon-induced very large GTPase 1-like [Peromyscus maniculatus bairdii]
MNTEENFPDKSQPRGRRQQDLQEMLTEVGLSVDYWLPILQQDLGVTCTQALQYLEERDLQKLKSQTQHSWEKKALKKLLELSWPNSVAEFQETPGEMIKNRQRQAGQALQELRALQSEGKNRQEEAVRRKEAELRQAMEIPEECWPGPEVRLKDVTETMERQLKDLEQKLINRGNLSDRDLVRWASGGLALQGIFKTCHQKDLVARREELLRVPKEFFLFGPEQGKRMEAKEFTSSQAESMFTKTVEKLGFGAMISAKDGHLGFSLEGGRVQSNHSESKDTHQTNSEHSYFCSAKFSYVPLASFHFRADQLQLSTAALKELKIIEEQLEHTDGPGKFLVVRNRTEKFFNRFGSHANQGPLHLGGIYCWKAISEGFKSDQLDHVKQQTAAALDSYIRGSSSGFGIEVVERTTASHSHYVRSCKNATNQQLQIKVQLSVAQIGGPAEANGIVQWTTGLLASNKTWSVIDQGLQLVPIWDIILSSHRNDFKEAFQVAKCLKDSYIALAGLAAQIQDEEYLYNIGQEITLFQTNMNFQEVSDYEGKLKRLIDFMTALSQKIRSYDIWAYMFSTDWQLQNFLLSTINFLKEAATYVTQFINAQLCRLVEPRVYKVTNFPWASSTMESVYQSESEEEKVKITSFSEFLKALKKLKKTLVGVNMKNKSWQTVEAAQRKATCNITTALSSFLNFLKEAEQPDMQLLLLSIAAGAGYQLESNVFQPLLGCTEINFFMKEIQTVQHKYQELKNICSYRAQAFLVLRALRATVGTTDVSTGEKRQRLALVRQHVGQLLSEEVANILMKHGAHHDWEKLENDLRLLIHEDCEATTASLQMDRVKKKLQSLRNEIKGSYKQLSIENNKKGVMDKESFIHLLQRLGLDHHYPKKMSRANFHHIYKNSVHKFQPSSEQELPFYFLQKLLMLDCRLRQLIFKDDGKTEYQVSRSSCNMDNDVFDPYEELFEESEDIVKSSAKMSQPHIHPMDIQMAIFHCADDLARQYILSKLSICQFALPLVVPNPNTSQMEFSLWSLRQIRRSWQESSKSPQDKSYSHRNQQMCCVSTPIVSFIRVGNGLSASKSQIMNSLLSKRKHDVFFHRHCRGSSKHCLLMEGVVEISWFCPGGQGEDRFDKCVTFTNLHGDAKEHRQQLSFLQDVSSLIVILMSASDDNKENQNLVRHLCQSSTPLICLLDDKKNVLGNNSGRRVRIGIRNRNEAELTEELTNAIKHLLELSDASLSLEDCSQMARRQGFLIDEDQKDCKEAKEKAEIIMALLAKQTLSKIKGNLLPLQGQLWHTWCKKDKELYHLREKGNRSIEQHKSDIDTQKQKIRYQQSEKALPLNGVMRSFLKILQEHKEAPSKHYVLHWLSFFLHNLTKGHLEKLQQKQRSLWSMVQTEKHKKYKSNSLTVLQNQIEAISTEIHDCTFGIEHLLREVGQIYEALEETSSTIDKSFLSFPEIAADLMVAGVPIELMDGDASYVPLKWVAAIFDKISEKLGDKRLFVLSILGLQSSGKSTLLNALFGLQFSVSVGRCTRGAYMQLLKVDEKFTKELGFDYMLAVDTEGLRAPEINNKSQNQDNELATFVIGLGNLTLINIFGENPSEMQDILQIVVQAFLRMKQVKISPSCLFVHQNVGEVTAKDQTMEGRRRLEQRLDEMTALAAEQEECSNITRFSDVIKFDASSHVYYFAHLWDGNPPMAPPNPQYSHNVQELKTGILRIAQEESRGKIMKISDVKFRVQDLWKALVSENFIFSFRNTKEVIVMSKLETMYNKWTWELRSHVLDLQNQLNNLIQNGKILTLTTNELEAPVNNKYETIQQDFNKYFEEDPDSETLVQWKANFEQKLQMLKDALISDIRWKGNELISLKQSQERLDNQKSQYEKELLERSRKLALSVKGKELSDKELHEKFDQLWTNWIDNVSVTAPPVKEPNIDLDSENILLEYFKKEKSIVERLKVKSGEMFEINYSKHVQMKKKCIIFPKSLETCHKESINKTTININLRVNETLKNIWIQKRDYSQNDFHEILRIIENELKSVPPEEDYTFTRDYTIDFSLWLFQRASKSFKEMHKAFKSANDPVNYLEKKKDDFFMSFKISCQGATSITSFVDFLWLKLTPAISDTIWDKMGPKIAGDMRATCPAFNGNRANLEKHILYSLAEEENFDKYWQYIHHPESFFRDYISDHIRRYCFEKGSEKVMTFLKISLGDIKNAIFTAIHKSTAVAKDKGSTASAWLDLFCDHLGSNLIFPRRDLISIEHQEIKDTEFLKEAMSTALDTAIRKVKENCSHKNIAEMVPDIEKLLSEHLCGCWKQCPFCKAICTNTISQHEGDHSVPFHRPQAVNGWHRYKTDHFVIDCCTSSVASDRSFILNDLQKFPYKKYREAGGNFATWSITPDSSTQPYWKWFVCHFRSELEEKYGKEFTNTGTIPDSWTKITKQEVLDDLKNNICHK